MPHPLDTNNEQLCFVTIVFPVPDDDTLIKIKNGINAVLKELPKVKVELRIAEIRDAAARV